jgi:hypothetical protein
MSIQRAGHRNQAVGNSGEPAPLPKPSGPTTGVKLDRLASLFSSFNFTDSLLDVGNPIMGDPLDGFARILANDQQSAPVDLPQAPTQTPQAPPKSFTTRLGGLQFGQDPRKLGGTGAGADVSVGRVDGRYHAGSTVNLKQGKFNVGAGAAVQADAINVTARAQLGDTGSATGGGYIQGTGRVGANASANAGLQVDPRQGTAVVRAGVEGFAGAEAIGSVGYGSRYASASVEGRAQAGIGGSAGVSAGINEGKVEFKADLGAVLGVGGRIRVDVSVNVAAIAEDTMKTVSDPGSAFNALRKGLGW